MTRFFGPPCKSRVLDKVLVKVSAPLKLRPYGAIQICLLLLLLLLEGITYFYSGGRDNDAALALGGRPIQQHEPAARHSLNTIPACDGQTHDDSIILHQHSVATRVALGR